MSLVKYKKLNYLLTHWSNSIVLTSHWLNAQGYYPQLVQKYCQSGWLRKIAPEAYAKLDEPVRFAGALSALQNQMHLPVHLGGLSALEHHGVAHYLALGSSHADQLFNTSGFLITMPLWFRQLFPDVTFYQRHLFQHENGLTQASVENISVEIATPERAILEVLALVPHEFDYQHAVELVENLQLLRPQLLNTLLSDCLSVKVTRLFTYLADRHQLACFKHLETTRFNWGHGKRVIGEGGQYIAKYQLSVPPEQNEPME